MGGTCAHAAGAAKRNASGAVLGVGAIMMNALLKVSDSLRRLLEWIALTSGWLLVIMACVTTFDVVARKIGFEREGLLRSRNFERGAQVDIVMLSLLAGDLA